MDWSSDIFEPLYTFRMMRWQASSDDARDDARTWLANCVPLFYRADSFLQLSKFARV